MDRNDSNIYISCNQKTWLIDMCHKSYLANGSHGEAKEMPPKWV